MNMSYLKNALMVSGLSLLLSACTVIPGSKVELSGKNVVSLSADKEADLTLDDVMVYQITPEFIKQLEVADRGKKPLVSSDTPNLTTNTSGYQYRVGVGDQLRIVVWNHPELMSPAGESGAVSARVDANGKIYFPFVGEVGVAGKSIKAIRKLLTQRLAQVIRNPQLDVSIGSYESQKVYISGEVGSPGIYRITHNPLTLLDLINQSGGITGGAKWNAVTLNREGVEIRISLEALLQDGVLTQNYLLKNGDTIHVPRNEKDRVYIMGEVMEARTVGLGRYGKSLTAALSDVGGLNENKSNPTGVFVIRSHNLSVLPEHEKRIAQTVADIYQLDLSDATALALGTEFELQAGDVIYVTAVPVARWNRVLSNLLPSVSSITALKGVATE